MSTTRHAGDVNAIFGINTITHTIETLAGDHAPDIDMHAAEAAYIGYLETLLPYGWTVSGNEVYRHVDAEALDADQVRQSVREPAGFDITQYIVDDGTDDAGRVQDIVEAEQRAYEDAKTVHALHVMQEWQSAHDALDGAIESGATGAIKRILARHCTAMDREALEAIRAYRNSLSG